MYIIWGLLQIVAILDKAFQSISKAKSNAQKNLLNSKELFETYLQSVFTSKGKDWQEKTLGNKKLIEIIDGDRGKNYPTKKDFMEEGYCLFMNTKNVRQIGLEFESKMFITESKDKAMGKGKLRRRDVIMTTRGTIGNIGIYTNDISFENMRINSGMLIFRPNENLITSEYLFEIFRSGIMKKQIEKNVSGAAQPQLPIKTLINFTFLLPNLEEQTKIVNEIKALSAEIKKLETIYKIKLADLDELTKSLLNKAFAGEL